MAFRFILRPHTTQRPCRLIRSYPDVKDTPESGKFKTDKPIPAGLCGYSLVAYAYEKRHG